jgi:hypothetical protein
MSEKKTGTLVPDQLSVNKKQLFHNRIELIHRAAEAIGDDLQLATADITGGAERYMHHFVKGVIGATKISGELMLKLVSIILVHGRQDVFDPVF